MDSALGAETHQLVNSQPGECDNLTFPLGCLGDALAGHNHADLEMHWEGVIARTSRL
jgi:hypothetical protein